MSHFENFEVKKNEFAKYDEDTKKVVLGRLKALEDLSVYINLIRESYTRELYVNGVEDETDILGKKNEKKDNLSDSGTLTDDSENSL